MSKPRLNYNPLVSIIVVTYNSSKYVLETLESAKAQTYRNIELIITDDGSKDNTVAICREWLKENKGGFVRTQLITVNENTGIPANCNRGVKAAQGVWVKLIAGDDALLEKCIFLNLMFVEKVQQASVIFSIAKEYLHHFKDTAFLGYRPIIYNENFFGSHVTALKQYKQLLIQDRIGFTATSFMKRSVLLDVNLFDERFKFIEDYPMWLKLTKAGFKLHFFPKETVKYRKHEESVHNTTKNVLINPSFLRNEALRKEYVYPYLSWNHRMDYAYRYQMSLFLKTIFSNNRNFITRQIAKLLLKHFNPFYWISRQ